MIDLAAERQEMLRASAEQRARQVMHYQVDIDNAERALEEIGREYGGNAAASEFAEQLREFQASAIREQTKEKIMLKVIRDQIGEGE